MSNPLKLPSLSETLLSQCNYICQTHLPVCQKNAMISLLVAEVVPEIGDMVTTESYLEELLIVLLIFLVASIAH